MAHSCHVGTRRACGETGPDEVRERRLEPGLAQESGHFAAYLRRPPRNRARTGNVDDTGRLRPRWDRAVASGQEDGMTAFTVSKFDSPDGADRAASTLKTAASEGMVKVLDHAVVSWPVGAARPSTSQGHEENWRGTGWGAFWGLLLGALFFVPVVGGAVDTDIGAISRATEGAGVRKGE